LFGVAVACGRPGELDPLHLNIVAHYLVDLIIPKYASGGWEATPEDRAVGRGEERGEVQIVLLFRSVRWVWPGMGYRLARCGYGVRK
jgi:hypothetical protein